jgi:hypothetical protein
MEACMADEERSIFDKAEEAIALLHANGIIPPLRSEHIEAIANATMKVAMDDYAAADKSEVLRLHNEKVDYFCKCISLEIAMKNMIALARPYFTDDVQLLAIEEAEKAMAMDHGWRAA